MAYESGNGELSIPSLKGFADKAGAALIDGDARSKWSYVIELRYLIILVIIGVWQGMFAPSVPYMVNSFFALSHGGGDCEADPKSHACRQGAVDAALYHGCSDAASNIGAMLFAATLGSYSDSVGRRPIIRTTAILGALPIVALYLHTKGLNLWVFLILDPLITVFDANGVFAAVMTDIIHKPEDRAPAFGIFIGATIAVLGLVMPFAYLLPQKSTLIVSLLATGLKIAYVFFVFPETAPKAPDNAQPLNPLHVARRAFKILTRNGFIRRMAAVLTLCALAGSGFPIVMPAFLTGYLGFTRQDKLILGIAAICSVMTSFLCILDPLVARIGNIRVLQMSLGTIAIFALVFPACSEKWHVWVLTALSSGPICLLIPLVAAIKSNLVTHSEQGILQGAIASIGKGAGTLGYVVFGFLLHETTIGGEVKSRSAVILPFFTIAGISLLSVLLACSLPTTPPPPPDEEMLDNVDDIENDASSVSGDSSHSASASEIELEDYTVQTALSKCWFW